MKIWNVVHPGLRSLIAEDEPAGPRGIDVSRLRRILSFLQDMAGESEPAASPVGRFNRRPVRGWGDGSFWAAPVGALTFGIDAQDDEITNLDYEGNG